MLFNDFSIDMEENIQLILCRPDKTEIGILDEYDRNFKFCYNDIDELSFSISPYSEDKYSKKKIKNKLYDLTIGDMLVCAYNTLNESKHYYTIVSEDENDDFSNESKKTIQCYSIEYLSRGLDFPSIQGTYQLYKSPTETVHIGEGILNIIEQISNWKIGYVSDKAKNNYRPIVDNNNIPTGNYEADRKFRIFDFDTQKILTVIREEIEKAFEVLCYFDTDKEEINVYSKDEIGENKGFYLSPEKYLKSLSKQKDYDEIVTQLKVYGYQGISIDVENPLGTDYVENFDYYRNDKYMDKELQNAFNRYDDLLKVKHVEFQQLNKQIKELQFNRSQLQAQLVALNGVVNQKEEILNIAIHDGKKDLHTENGALNQAKNNVILKDNEIKMVTQQIQGLTNAIKSISNEIKKENNFTKEQMKVIYKLTKTDTWNNENYDNKLDLYNAGLNAITKMNEPSVEYSISIQDILKDKKNKHNIAKLNKGDLLNLHIEERDIDIELRMIEFNYSDKNNSESTLDIIVSNLEEKTDAYRYMGNSSIKQSKATNTVVTNSFRWDYGYLANEKVDAVMNNNLNAAKNAVMGGYNQGIRIDGHGIELENMTNGSRRIKIINDCLAMTTDGWNTASLAITPEGIIAQTIIGQLIISKKLKVENENGYFSMDENGFYVKGDKFLINGVTMNNLISDVESKIEVVNDRITVEVMDKIKETSGAVNVLKDEVELKVSKGEVIQSINLNTDGAKIKADKVELTGYATFTDLATPGKTIINAGNIDSGTITGIELKGVNINGSEIKGGNVDTENFSSHGEAWFFNNVTIQEALEVQKYIGCWGDITSLSNFRVGDSTKPTTTGEIKAYNMILGDSTLIGTGNLKMTGDLTCAGKKNRIVETKDYGTRALNAYETTQCLFGHIGRDKLKDGKCIIKINDIFKQTVNLKEQYEVRTWAYGNGNVWVDIDTMTEDSFIVYGTSDIDFGYEIIAKQNGYENVFLEQIK